MELKDVQNFFTENKDKDDVKTFVAGLNPVTLDRVKEFVGKDHDASAWFDSEKDKHLQKGLETFKTNHLQELVDAEYKKQHPDADPKDTKIAALEKQFADMKAEGIRKDLTNKALKVAGEKKLSSEFVSYFANRPLVGKDEDETNKNLEMLETMLKPMVNSIAEERFKGGYKPPKADPKGSGDELKDQIFSTMGVKEK